MDYKAEISSLYDDLNNGEINSNAIKNVKKAVVKILNGKEKLEKEKELNRLLLTAKNIKTELDRSSDFLDKLLVFYLGAFNIQALFNLTVSLQADKTNIPIINIVFTVIITIGTILYTFYYKGKIHQSKVFDYAHSDCIIIALKELLQSEKDRKSEDIEEISNGES